MIDRDEVLALVAKWRDEQAAYPPTPEGQHAAAAVRCCANELEALATEAAVSEGTLSARLGGEGVG